MFFLEKTRFTWLWSKISPPLFGVEGNFLYVNLSTQRELSIYALFSFEKINWNDLWSRISTLQSHILSKMKICSKLWTIWIFEMVRFFFCSLKLSPIDSEWKINIIPDIRRLSRACRSLDLPNLCWESVQNYGKSAFWKS